MARVPVIMPARNRAHVLRPAIESVLAPVADIAWVVRDGSRRSQLPARTVSRFQER